MNQKDVLIFFSKWIESNLGIIYEEHNLYQLQDRLDQIAKHFNLKSSIEVWQKAQSGISGEFKQLLMDVATNNETSFFRDKKFFDCLASDIIPSLSVEAGDLSKLNIWSVACSTGQEPYSVAMILSEMANTKKVNPPKIMATDISSRVIEKAQSGVYTELEVGRGLPLELRDRYFKFDQNKKWILSRQIISLVEFQKLNLRDNIVMPRKFDLILCRNVLIYQRVEAKVAIIDQIVKFLRPGGIFLMGSGESLIGLSKNFEQTLLRDVAVYRLKKREIVAA
jgi:chemotaxis protein methyltransferase CheR